MIAHERTKNSCGSGVIDGAEGAPAERHAEGDLRFKDGLPYAVRVIGKGDKERTVVLARDAQRALHQWLRERQKLVAELPPAGDAEYLWAHPGR